VTVKGAGRTSLRDEHARATREAIVVAAHELFVQDGYTATSIRAIAARARVSEQTVYRLFDSKAGLLQAAVTAAVSGSAAGSTLPDAGAPLAGLATARTPTEGLAAIGAWIGQGYKRGVAELEEVVFSAAAADPRVRELARYIQAQRYQDVRLLVDAVIGQLTPPPGLNLDDVADYIYAVESSPVYRQLVGERGWSTEKYVAWFERMVDRLFLAELPKDQGEPPPT
jgi:AcrR family transcriptional regulator